MGNKTGHDYDCTIYAPLHEGGLPECGICVCGYGYECARNGDHSEMHSEELKLRMINDRGFSGEAFEEELGKLFGGQNVH